MDWDVELLAWCNRGVAHPALDLVMVLVTIGAMPVGAVAPVGVWLAGKRREAIGLLVTFVVSTLLAVGVQFLVGRARPAGVRLVLPMSAFPSFPSGHAAAAFGGAVLAGLRWRRATPVALGSAALVSFSRVYLGQHYPGDVLGGALLGAGVAAAVYGAWLAPAGARWPRWAWLLWGQAALAMFVSLAAYLGLLRLDALGLSGMDKVLHFLLTGGVAFFAMGWRAGRQPGAVLVGLGVLAAVEECLQALSPVRTFDVGDLAAAVAGIAVAGWVGRRWEALGRVFRLVTRRYTRGRQRCTET